MTTKWTSHLQQELLQFVGGDGWQVSSVRVTADGSLLVKYKRPIPGLLTKINDARLSFEHKEVRLRIEMEP